MESFKSYYKYMIEFFVNRRNKVKSPAIQKKPAQNELA